MTLQIRQKLIAAVTFISGLYFFLEYMLPEKIGEFKFGLYHESILRGVTVVGTMAIGLGLINIMRVHGVRLVKGQRGWPNSVALLAGLLIMFYVQGAESIASQKNIRLWKPLAETQLFLQKIAEDAKAAPQTAEPRLQLAGNALDAAAEKLTAAAEFQLQHFTAGRNDEIETKLRRAKEKFSEQRALVKPAFAKLRAAYQSGDDAARDAATKELDPQLKMLAGTGRDLGTLVFERHPIHRASHLLQQGFFVPLGAAMFSLLAFYIASAAYRSFRVKSVEASVMMLTAVVVILGQIPFGPIYISKDLPAVRLWLLQYINTPGNRAIYFGTTIAAFAMAVRMWFSLERNPLDLEAEEGTGGK